MVFVGCCLYSHIVCHDEENILLPSNTCAQKEHQVPERDYWLHNVLQQSKDFKKFKGTVQYILAL